MLNSCCLSSHNSQQMLKISSTRIINGHIDASVYGLSHGLKVPGTVRNCLAGIKLSWWSVSSFSVDAEYISSVIVPADKNKNHGSPTRDHRASCGYICKSILFYVFIFLPCISKYPCNEISLMLYLSSLYWLPTPLHVSGLLVAHHQEVAIHICNNWYVLYVLFDYRRARRQSTKTYNT
jgi:hypothetical protein